MNGVDEVSFDVLEKHVDLFRRVADLADPQSGALRRASVSERNDFGMPCFSATVRFQTLYHDGSGFLPGGFVAQGSGLTFNDALRRAVGEALERSGACDSGLLGSTTGSFTQLDTIFKGEVLCPPSRSRHAPCFDEATTGRLGFTPFTNDTPLRWMPMISVLDRSRLFVPANFVLYPYAPAGDERQIDLCTTAGLACGDTFADAACAAVLEIVEQDAFVLA